MAAEESGAIAATASTLAHSIVCGRRLLTSRCRRPARPAAERLVLRQPEAEKKGMARNGGQIGMSEGEKKLHNHCVDVAEGLGLEVDSASWSIDLVTKEHILTVVAKTGTTEM